MKTKSPLFRIDRLLLAFAILITLLAPQLRAQAESTNTNDTSYIQPLWGGFGLPVSGGTTSEGGTSDSGGATMGTMSLGGTSGGAPLGDGGGEFQVQTSLTSSNYTQNFSSLGTATVNNIANRNLANVSTNLNGWYFLETGSGANSNVVASTGSLSTGDTYNFGLSGNADRSLGSLRSGSVVPSFGFLFTNNTGGTITNLSISYTGETWRVGATGRADSLQFSYSTDATSLSSGTWTVDNALGYTNVSTNATGSGSVLQSSNIAGSISVSLLNGSTFFMRWVDQDATGADDGMAIDDFSLTAFYQIAAAILNWAGGSGDWSTGFSSTPVNGSELAFSGSGGAATNNQSSLQIASLVFSNGAGSYTNSGNAFTVSNGIVNNSANAQIFSNAITLGAAQAFNAAAGAMTFAGDITNGGNVLTVSGASNTVISGIISGGAGLTKTGLGTLTLNGVNTFTGAVTINGGVVAIDADAELGNSANDITLSSATLQTTASINMGSGRDLSGSGTLNIANGTTLTNGGTVNMTALTLANSGTFEMSGASKTLNSLTFSVASTLTNNGAAANIGGTVTANNTDNTVVMAGAYDLGATSRTFSVANGTADVDMQLTGAISSASATTYLTKSGLGRLEVNGVNTGLTGSFQLGFAGSAASGSLLIGNKDALGLGSFRFNSGTLEASTALTGANKVTNDYTMGGRDANAAILGGANAIEMSGGLSWFTGTNNSTAHLAANNQATLSGVLGTTTNTGVSILFSGAGTLTLAGTSANLFTNAVTVSNGLSLVVTKNSALGTGDSGTTVQSGAELVVDGVNYSTAEALSIAGTGKGGAGALRGTNTSSYAGAVTASGATTVTADSGASFTISGAFNAGGSTLTAGGAGDLLLSGAVSNGNISKTGAGSLTISNASSSFGTLTTGTGTTAIAANATATGLAGSGALNLAGGTFTLSNSTAQTFSGAMSGSGGFVKTGAGTATLSGSSGSFAGATTVTNGTLVVNGALSGSAVSVGHASSANGSVLMGTGSVGATTINTNGRISPGNSVGILSVSNTLTLNGGGSYLWEITNSTANTPGVGWDLITVDTATAGDGLGTLNLPGSGQFTVNGIAIDGFTFDGNSNYTNNYFLIVEAANFSGSLGNLAFLGTGLGSGSWTFSTNNVGLFLNYTAAAGEVTFTNTGTVFQGDADVATPAGPWGLIDGTYAVVVNGGGTVIMTNTANSYSGTTTIKDGTLRADVDAGNGVNGAFGNAITAIAVGNDTGSASATLDIGVDGVTIGRAVNVVSGSSGTKTVGTSLTSGTATYSGAVNLDASATLTAGGTANAVFSGVVSGAGGVTKAGSGTVTLSGGAGNTFAGTTTVSAGTLLLNKSSGNALATNVTVNGGTLLLGAADQIAAATVTLGGGTFDVAGFNDTIGTLQLNSGTLAGSSGILTATTYNLAGGTLNGNLGTGTINASANAALNGTASATAINITGGTLTLGSAGRLIGTTPTVVITNGAALALGGNESIGTLNLTNGTVSGSGTLSVSSAINAQTGSISANVGGAAGLTKTTASTVTLSGANTFSGAVAVNGGVLALTNGSALSDSSAVTLANTAGVILEVDSNETIGSLAGGGSTGGTVALDVNTLTLSQSANTTYTGTITGTGRLAKSGSGTLTFNQASAIGTDFDMVINGGTIDFNRGSGNPISVLLGTGNTIQLNGGTVSFSSSSAANGAITFGGLAVTADSTILIARLGANSSHSTVITAPLSFSNNANLSFAYNSTITGGTTSFSGASNTLNSDATITQTNYTVVISAAIDEAGGSRSLTKAGLGTLSLNAANTYTGDTIVAGGELRLTNANSRLSDSSLLRISNGANVLLGVSDTIKGLSGAGNISVGTGAILTTANIGTDTFSGAITNLGGFTKAGAGTQILTGANTYSGGTLVSAGRLVGDTRSLQGTITNNAAVTFSQTTNGTYASAMSGSGSLAKAGSGTVTLSSTVAAAAVDVVEGAFTAGSASRFTGTPTVTVSNGAALNLVGNETFGSLAGDGSVDNTAGTLTVGGSGSSTTFSGALSGAGALTKTGAGTFTLTSSNNSYSGGTTINAGAIEITGPNRLGSSSGALTINDGKLLLTTTGLSSARNIVLGNANSTIEVATGLSYTANSNSIVSGSGKLNKSGAGTLVLNGVNSYNGGTALNEGVLRLGSTSAAGTGSITQADGTSTLEINTTGTVANQMSIFNVRTLQTVTLSGNKTLNNATYTVDAGTTTTESGVLSGSGGITKEGTGSLVVTASNSFTGATLVNAGTLNLNSSTGSALGGSTNVTVAATLLISQSNQVNNSASVTLSGGTITRGSGVSETFGALSLTDASFLDFGSGTEGNLAFGTYTSSSLLTLNNFFGGNVLSFNSDLTGSIAVGTYDTTSYLSGDGLFQINSISGGFTTSYSGGTFTITAIPEPSTYLAAAGLLGMMLWPSRKRIVRDAKKILGLRAPMRDRLAARRA